MFSTYAAHFLREAMIQNKQSTSFILQRWRHYRLQQLLTTASNTYPTTRGVSSTIQRQTQLPHLPVPSLQETLQKYLKTVEPFVSTQEFETTKKLVQQFESQEGIGQKLQKLLLEKAQKTDCWLADWWLTHSYMGFRWPVVVYSSPGMVMPQQNYKSSEDRLMAAARVILATMDYKRMVDMGELPPETMGNALLDMSQHGKMFGTCRIPGIQEDELIFSNGENQPLHIIVAHNNSFFKVNVCDQRGYPYSETVLMNILKEIVDKSPQPVPPVGLLTSQNRDVWGSVYRQLRTNPKNQESLGEIQKSLYLICIDQPNPSFKDLNNETVAAMQAIHGCGDVNGGNRWYDKTIQFIFGTNGEIGISYEHSPAEGPPISNLSDYAMDFILGKKKGIKVSNMESGQPIPRLLEFDLSVDIQKSIEDAKTHLNSIVHDLDMSCFTFQPYGKNFIKSQKLSPDSFIQMAMQLAFFRIHRVPGATYETASTRQYLHGRTETIRSASTESTNFCRLMLEQRETTEQQKVALHKAIAAHKQYVFEAVKGFGVDRHLLGLKLIALEKGWDVPALFKDPGYVRSSHFRISSSQVAARHRSFMCYGPLVPDGYGCCYNPRDDDIIFGISAFNSCKETSALAYRNALHQSLVDMQNLLIIEQKSKL